MDHHPADLLLVPGWNWMISCRMWGGVTGGCASKPEGDHWPWTLLHCHLRLLHLPPLGETSSLIYSHIWEAIFQSHRTLCMFQSMQCHLQAWFDKNAIISHVNSRQFFIKKYKSHRCFTSGHNVYLCLFAFGNYMADFSCESPIIWSVFLDHIPV